MPLPLICPTQSTPPSTGAANFQRVWWLFFSQITDWVNGAARNFIGTHAGRVNDFDPAAYPMGTTYYETDRTVTYTILPVLGINVWRWTSGTYSVASLTVLPTGLGVNDTGLLVYDLTLMHIYQWTGTVWQFAPGDPGAAFTVATNRGGAPRGGVWQKCDGTAAITISKGDGTVDTITMPNFYQLSFGVGGGGCLLAAGTPGYVGPSAPSWDTGATAKTETEAAHTHSIGQGSVNQGSLGSVTVDTAATTGAGTAHSHTLTDANAKLKKPSDGNDANNGGGMPDHYRQDWYMRR